jgi:soluble lytic murein transglycosylase-like protein
MSTKTRISAAAKRRRQQVMMQRRIACLVVSTGLVVGTVFTTNLFHQKSVQALNDEIESLSNQVSELTTRNQDLSAALQESNDKLRLFVDDTEVRAAEPAYYDIPLSKELQLYTYTRCVDYGIADHYELVLAMMWQESNFTPDTISKTNDYGIMQINVCNHEWLMDVLGTTNFLDVSQNIDAGTYIISKLLIKYEDEHKALMAYNMGERGASLNWEAGIYTSNYSCGVVAKREAIEANNYNAN